MDAPGAIEVCGSKIAYSKCLMICLLCATTLGETPDLFAKDAIDAIGKAMKNEVKQTVRTSSSIKCAIT